jgi:outer membrane immunogenic protein
VKLSLLGAVTSIAMLAAGQSFAADMAVKGPPAAVVSPVTAWGGFYFGASVGAVRDRPDPWLFDSGFATGPFSGQTAFIAGLHTTAMWQFSFLVVGWETDLRLTGLTSTTSCPSAAFLCRQHTSDIFTTGPRAGFAWNDWQIYGTGGYARADISTATIAVATGANFDTTSLWHDGWFGGAGIEWAWTQNIHFGLQYTHIKLRTQDDMVAAGGLQNRTVNDRIDMIEARVNFKLWGQDGPFSGK